MPNVVLPYDPRSQFLPFHNRVARFSDLVCHRRSGKTVAAVNDLIIGAVECDLPRPQLAYIAPTYQMAKRIAWEYVKYYAEPLIDRVHEAELRVTLKTGAKIYLLGAENADALRGLYLDGAVMDEYGQIRPTVLSQIILPCLADRKGWLVRMGTPRGKNHFYDSYKASLGNPKNFTMLLRASESGIIDKEELDLMRSQMDDSDYMQEFECSFEASLKGAIYGADMELAEKEGRIRPFSLDPALPVDCITDLGFTDDTVLGFFQQGPSGILMHEVYADSQKEWDTYLDEMDLRNVRQVYLPHDARAKNLQTGRSIVEQTIKRDYRPIIVPDHKLRDGIAATHKVLPYVYWNLPLCSNAVEAMKSYRREWDDKNACYKERPMHDWASHTADMVRYLGIVFQNLRPLESKIILPDSMTRPADYSFTLEDLFTHASTNPALREREWP